MDFFLNIFCETYASMPYYDRKWLRSLWVLYRQYIYMRERAVAEVVDEDPELNITWHYLCRLAHLSVFTYKFHPITRTKQELFLINFVDIALGASLCCII